MTVVPAFLEIQSLFGLPAHPFLLHAPLVLVPLLGLAVIGAMLAKPATRRRLAGPLAVAGVVVLVLLQLAIGSGEALRQSDADARASAEVSAHAELADTLRLTVAAMTGALLVLALLDRGAAGPAAGDAALPPTEAGATDRRRFLAGTLRAVAGAAGATAIVWTFRTGHTGATAVWADQALAGGGGKSDGDADRPAGSAPKPEAGSADADADRAIGSAPTAAAGAGTDSGDADADRAAGSAPTAAAGAGTDSGDGDAAAP